MGGVFVSKDFIDIDIKYVVTDGDSPPIIIETPEDEAKHKDNIKILKTKWARQNWRLANELTRDSMTYNSVTGDPAIDVFKLRDLRIKKFLKSWDLKDKNGVNIPCTSEMIDELHPVIATVLITKYNDKVLPNEEEQKN